MTDVATSLPDVELAPGATITVSFDDANTKITQLNVYGISPVTGQEVAVPVVSPLFVYGPTDGAA